jgi:MFS family permease
MFLATVPALLLIDKLGRRPLLIAGGLGMTVCLAIVAALSGRYEDHWDAHPGGSWAAATFVWLYIACFGFSWGPVSWVAISELMPLSARAPGTALGASTNWMVNFCVSFMVPPMMESITYGTCELTTWLRILPMLTFQDIFFMGFMLMGVAYAIWLLPETRNVSLEAMDKVFNSNDAVHDAVMMDRITQRLQAEYYGDAASSSHEKEDRSVVE